MRSDGAKTLVNQLEMLGETDKAQELTQKQAIYVHQSCRVNLKNNLRKLDKGGVTTKLVNCYTGLRISVFGLQVLKITGFLHMIS